VRRKFGVIAGHALARQPGAPPAAQESAARDRGEIVEVEQLFLFAKRLQHAERKGRAANAAAGERDAGEAMPNVGVRRRSLRPATSQVLGPAIDDVRALVRVDERGGVASGFAVTPADRAGTP